jgi:hypothetical protein
MATSNGFDWEPRISARAVGRRAGKENARHILGAFQRVLPPPHGVTEMGASRRKRRQTSATGGIAFAGKRSAGDVSHAGSVAFE